MYLENSPVSDRIVRAHTTFSVRPGEVAQLEQSVLTIWGAQFTRRERYYDTPSCDLANHGFSLKTTDQKEKPWVLEEASGMQAEAKSKDDLMPLVANILKRRDVVVTRIGEISVRVRVYSLRCFNDWWGGLDGWRVEFLEADWVFENRPIFCRCLDVATRSASRDPRDVGKEIVATMEKLNISYVGPPMGLTYLAAAGFQTYPAPES